MVGRDNIEREEAIGWMRRVTLMARTRSLGNRNTREEHDG
jgi:hypothetical protein